MRKTHASFLVSLLLASFSLPAWAVSPVGQWTTIDDHTKKPRARMEVWLEGNKLYGKVIELLAPDAKTICSPDAPADKRNKPIVGLTVLWGLTEHGTEWNGGTILDPANGKTYSCILKVVDEGKKLSLRGYIFNPLLGRNQTWIKAE